MKNRLLTTALVALFTLAACGRAESAQKSADPAMWVVSDADTKVYIFGSVHMLKPGTVWFDDEVKAAFDSSDELVTEVIEPEPASMAAEVAKLAINTDGPPTSQLLNETQRAAYARALSGTGMSVEMMDHFDPWMAAISLSVTPLSKLGYSRDAGIEAVLEKAAKAAGKRQSGLESVNQQLGYFDTMPRPLQIAFLNATVEETAGAEKQFSRLVKDWSRGNISALGKEMNGSLEKTPELARILLFERNARWAQWIKTRMEQPGTIFIAVGAGHLAGKDSLIDKLGALGIPTHRVRKHDFATGK